MHVYMIITWTKVWIVIMQFDHNVLWGIGTSNGKSHILGIYQTLYKFREK